MVLLILILALSALFIYYTVFKPMGHWKRKNVPYTKPLPLIGNMGSFLLRNKNICQWQIDTYNSVEDSRYIGFYSFRQPILMLKDVNLIKQLAIKDFDHFVDHRQFISEEIDPLFGKNLFSLQGDRWRQMRSTMSPAFTGNKMRAMFILISDSLNESVNYFTKTVQPDEPLIIELKDFFTRIANDVIASVAFGIKTDSLVDKENAFYLMAKDATTFTGLKSLKFFGSSISMTLMKLLRVQFFSKESCDFFRNLVVDNIKMREENNIIRPDMIHLLMEARKGKLKHIDIRTSVEDSAGFATVEESNVGKDASKAKVDLTDDDITAQSIGFIFGGFDTISTLLCHMAYELAINVDVQKKLQQEIDDLLEECNGKLTYEGIMKMKYMDMVTTEVLRKWPVGALLDRICTDSYTIEPDQPGEEPIHLNKGDVVWIPIFAMHRDPNFFPDPEKFDPERFSDENKGNIIPYSYLPFGVGPRNCIGSRFALLEVKITFFQFLSKFNFELCGKSQVPLQLTTKTFSMVGEKGFWVGLKMRNVK